MDDRRRRGGRSRHEGGGRDRSRTKGEHGSDSRRSAGRKPAGADGPRRTVPEPKRSSHPPVHLSDEIVGELRSTARPGKGDILVKVFAEAAAAFAAGDLAEAVRLGEQAKHIALRSGTARELLGLTYYRVGRFKDAARELAAFRRLSGSKAQNPVLADCYRAQGRPDRALELCDEIDPADVDEDVFYEAQIVAAGALADAGRLQSAVARLEALDLRPRTAGAHHLRAWYALGDLLERAARFTQAREWFSAVAAADPDLTDAPERARRLGAS